MKNLFIYIYKNYFLNKYYPMKTRLQIILALTLLVLPCATFAQQPDLHGGIELLSSDALDQCRVVAVGTDPARDPMLTVKKDNWLSSPGFNCLPVSESSGEIKPNIEPRFEVLSWNQLPSDYSIIYNFPFRSSRVRRSVECSLRESLPQINANE